MHYVSWISVNKVLTPSQIREAVAARLKQVMRKNNVTIVELAGIINMSDHTLQAVLRQERDLKVTELYYIAKHFKIDIGFFLPWDLTL